MHYNITIDMAHSSPTKSMPISKIWPKMSKTLVIDRFHSFRLYKFFVGESKKVSGGIRTHDLSIIGSARYLGAITPSLYERILLWFIYAYGNFKTHFFRQWVAIHGKYFTVHPFIPYTIVCIGSHSKSR